MIPASIEDLVLVAEPQAAARGNLGDCASRPDWKAPVTAAMTPTLADVLPAACLAATPVDVPVGVLFDTLVLPEPQARQAMTLLARHHPHPVGAAIARPGEWVLLLPPGSGCGTDWAPAVHQDSGTLQVPPVLAPDDGRLRWARRGTRGATGRAFTSPMVLHPVLPFLSPLPGTFIRPVPDSQMPVRI
jgi:uncharacterized protein YceK